MGAWVGMAGMGRSRAVASDHVSNSSFTVMHGFLYCMGFCIARIVLSGQCNSSGVLFNDDFDQSTTIQSTLWCDKEMALYHAGVFSIF